jgi:hypothetical protein
MTLVGHHLSGIQKMKDTCHNPIGQIMFYSTEKNTQKHEKLDSLTFHSYSLVDDEPTLSSPPMGPFQVL